MGCAAIIYKQNRQASAQAARNTGEYAGKIRKIAGKRGLS
jgi:hypothetical protein